MPKLPVSPWSKPRGLRKGREVLTDQTAIIGRVLQSLLSGGRAAAADILRAEYPFIPVTPEGRRYTELQSLQVFLRDGFVDRYSGQRLVFPGSLRLLSRVFPQEFPFQRNWKMAETHPAYWELFPQSTTCFLCHGVGPIAT